MKPFLLAAALLSLATAHSAPVTTTEALVAAVRDGAEGATIEIGPGTFQLAAPLEPKPGMTLKGAGMDRTVLTHTADWKPSVKTLPDPEMKTQGMDTRAYLIRLPEKAANITISGLTLHGPQLHGAVFGFGNEDLHIHHVRVKDVLWAGIRTFSMKGAKIHDCEFIDAGGRWQRGGIPGIKGGITGGGIFAIWMKDSEIAHNRFTRTQMAKQDEFYGIKVRQAKRCRVHHNTIGVNFSMEFPFENDEDVEIDHNICHGTISIPKHAGGPVPESGRTFHLHHNYLTSCYAIEFPRNGIEIDHNLFDFDVEKDGGNLISGFGKAAAKGPAVFHNNLVSNPGRGVIWINEPYNNLTVRNNHVITRTTATPRKDGLFGFNKQCDFSTFRIVDNIIECRGLARPLVRNDASYGMTTANNTLTNVSDTTRYKNPKTGNTPGLEAPLQFQCGVHGELTVDGWETRPTNP
jgi:nitrous oxidase accessory protein